MIPIVQTLVLDATCPCGVSMHFLCGGMYNLPTWVQCLCDRYYRFDIDISTGHPRALDEMEKGDRKNIDGIVKRGFTLDCRMYRHHLMARKQINSTANPSFLRLDNRYQEDYIRTEGNRIVVDLRPLP